MAKANGKTRMRPPMVIRLKFLSVSFQNLSDVAHQKASKCVLIVECSISRDCSSSCLRSNANAISLSAPTMTILINTSMKMVSSLKKKKQN